MYTFENAKAELQVNKSTFSKSGYEFMENILTELQETYSPVFFTDNHQLYRLAKSRNRHSYARFMREVKELRRKFNGPKIHGISTKTWAGIYFGYVEVKENDK